VIWWHESEDRDSSKHHWLDAGAVEHSKQTVEDVKAVWRILPVFLCLPLFWSLFDQQVRVMMWDSDE
jgi:dipeptide/tripeptide permease